MLSGEGMDSHQTASIIGCKGYLLENWEDDSLSKLPVM